MPEVWPRHALSNGFSALYMRAGTDGVRTLTALYDAGPSKLNKWSERQGESGTAADMARKGTRPWAATGNDSKGIQTVEELMSRRSRFRGSLV